MKTLILNGSPRKNGDTVFLIKKLTEQLSGEYRIVDAYYENISPCIDCRYCWSNKGCSIDDEMTEIYDYIADCDNIVIASPIYFSQLTGKLLDVCSRFQTYFAAKKFRNQTESVKTKKGAIVLVGGGDGNPEEAYKTACTALYHINVKEFYHLIGSFNTNNTPSMKDEKALKEIEDLINYLTNR